MRLEDENSILKNKLSKLEEHLDDIESQNCSNNLIISGKFQTALLNDSLPHSVLQLLRNKVNYELPLENIISVYRIGSKSSAQSPDNRNIILKMLDADSKRVIISAFRTVKPQI